MEGKKSTNTSTEEPMTVGFLSYIFPFSQNLVIHNMKLIDDHLNHKWLSNAIVLINWRKTSTDWVSVCMLLYHQLEDASVSGQEIYPSPDQLRL